MLRRLVLTIGVSISMALMLDGGGSAAHAVPAAPTPHVPSLLMPVGGHWYGGVWIGGPAYYGYGGGYYPEYSYSAPYRSHYNYDDGYYSRSRCGWLRHRAEETGSRYWWRRYRACIDD